METEPSALKRLSYIDYLTLRENSEDTTQASIVLGVYVPAELKTYHEVRISMSIRTVNVLTNLLLPLRKSFLKQNWIDIETLASEVVTQLPLLPGMIGQLPGGERGVKLLDMKNLCNRRKNELKGAASVKQY